MSEHKVWVDWTRAGAEFRYESYPREHRVRFEGGFELTGSAAPAYLGDGAYPNPEDALVYAISSCHMLSFLAIAAKRGLSVEAYQDHAIGVLAKNQAGKLAVTRVTLRPKVRWQGPPPPAETVARIHEASHRECFIANSVMTAIEVIPE